MKEKTPNYLCPGFLFLNKYAPQIVGAYSSPASILLKFEPILTRRTSISLIRIDSLLARAGRPVWKSFHINHYTAFNLSLGKDGENGQFFPQMLIPRVDKQEDLERFPSLTDIVLALNELPWNGVVPLPYAGPWAVSPAVFPNQGVPPIPISLGPPGGSISIILGRPQNNPWEDTSIQAPMAVPFPPELTKYVRTPYGLHNRLHDPVGPFSSDYLREVLQRWLENPEETPVISQDLKRATKELHGTHWSPSNCGDPLELVLAKICSKA